MTPGNDNGLKCRHMITVESGDGELHGLYLVSLLEAGSPEPINARICTSKDEAYDFAREVMRNYPDAVFHDQSEGGA